MSMFQCASCGQSDDLPFECNYCGGRYCSNHRLPEAHDCDGVEFLADDDRWFRDKSTGEIVSSPSDFDTPEAIEPKYTVGTRPEPDYESAPEVELKTNRPEETSESGPGIVARLMNYIFGR